MRQYRSPKGLVERLAGIHAERRALEKLADALPRLADLQPDHGPAVLWHDATARVEGSGSTFRIGLHAIGRFVVGAYVECGQRP